MADDREEETVTRQAPRVQAWRDVDSNRPTVGFYVTRHGAALYLWRRTYHVLWL